MSSWRKILKRGVGLTLRAILFLFTLTLGTTAVMLLDETSGLALTDLSSVPVQTMAVSDNSVTMVAVLRDDPPGVYRSEDQGHTWQRAGAAPSLTVNALAIHPLDSSVVFAGTAGGPVATTHNLWRSNNGGQSWQKFFLSLPSHPDGTVPSVTSLVVDAEQPDVLYVGTDGQGVYRFDVGLDGQGFSLMGGVSYHNLRIVSLAVGFGHKIYALAENGLFASGDGEDWQPINSPGEQLTDIVASRLSNTIYGLGANGQVYRSADGGLNWMQVGQDWLTVPGAILQGAALGMSPGNDRHVVLATAYQIDGQLVGGNVYETHEGGQSWVKIADAHGVVERLWLTQDGHIFGIHTTGLSAYETTAKSSASAWYENWQPPSYAQVIVILLTAFIASLVLFGQVEWLEKVQATS